MSIHRRGQGGDQGLVVLESEEPGPGALLDGVEQDYKIRANRSLKTLVFRLAPLRAHLGDMRAVHVTASVVERFKARRLAEGSAKATINRSLAALRRAYRLAVKHKLVAPGRVPEIELFPEANALTVILSSFGPTNTCCAISSRR